MKGKGITGSTLKIIAIAAMLLDHIGAVILERMIVNGVEALMLPYVLLRLVGRLAFPIFCFLLVEGFSHTRSKKRYALRLFGFSLISEVPFDLAVKGKVFDPGYQNVFFTLLIGFLAMWAFEAVKDKLEGQEQRTVYGAYTVVAVIACLFAYLIKSDYSAFGVLAIIVMYFYREEKAKSMLFGTAVLVISNVLEIFALVDIVFVAKYNKERGLNLKYVFYLFYPVHMLVLYLIAYCMGLIV